MNNPDAPCTPGQTWGIFKLVRRDVRSEFTEKKVTKQQASNLMQAAYDIRNGGGTAQEADDALNEALASL